jgi:ATP-dependent Clp protease ATP-binding subunit ClpC
MTEGFNLSFVQIMLAAREEARRLNQSSLGVAHVFMALCRLGGFTERLLRRQGVEPRAVRSAIGRAAGKRVDSEQRPGIHYTPRLRAILNAIDADAAREMTADIAEAELLKAIIHEGDSLPIRVLRDMGVDLAAVLARHESLAGEGRPAAPAVPAELNPEDYQYLMRFGRDLTQLAREGQINPVIGRDDELRHLEQTLVRATKSNPVLLGEAGVGKTAIVEGLAWRIAHDQVIPALRGQHIIEINMTLVTAGTKYRGAFEENLIKIIEAVQRNPAIILAMDELHTLVGSGASEGGLDASNIMKPALARGEVRLIGATTLDEYRRYIEPDAALERRFQRIVVDEPGQEETLAILAGIRERFMAHHKVEIEEGALAAAVELSARFLPDRHLPDKAIDLLDETCAYARVQAGGIRPDRPAPVVGSAQVIKVLAEWTGLPIADLTSEQRQRLIEMPTVLAERVIGQPAAIRVVTRVMETALSGLRHADRPMAVLLFVGPTGVGKTELAKALAQFLFGSEQELIRLDMSEYQERHEVARLIGAPPGYLGHEEAGQLTESLRNKPYSVVLLDEIEKAHPDVFDLFLQLFDDGRLTDGHGRTTDGRNAIFIMTSNLGSELYDSGRGIGFRPEGGAPVSSEEMVRECKRFFRPEFLNRIDEIVVFEPLSRQHLERIVQKLLAELSTELAQQGIAITLTSDAAALLAEEGYEPMYGARPLRRTFDRLLVQPLAHRLVEGEFAAGDRLVVDVAEGRLVIAEDTVA